MNKLGTLLRLLAGGAKDAVASGNLGKVAELIDEYKLTVGKIPEIKLFSQAEQSLNYWDSMDVDETSDSIDLFSKKASLNQHVIVISKD